MLSDDKVQPVHWHRRDHHRRDADPARRHRREAVERLGALLSQDDALARRFERVASYQRTLRASEYLLTNACNIRCKGCWFFETGQDKFSREQVHLPAIEAFVAREATERRINLAVVIGGEPALFPARLALYVKYMRHVNIATNGLKKLPVEGFENVGVGVSVWGGGPLDDELRAIKPGGKRFEGLFETALDNYRDDRRALFLYSVNERSVAHIEPTVLRIRENGNPLIFSYYSDYSSDAPIASSPRQELTQEMLRVRALYPDTVISHPYYIQALVSGRSHWDSFGYHTCPSISRDHPAHAARLANGNPTMPSFNTFAADTETVTFCCTAGQCDGCRDGNAMGSWFLVNMHRFTDDLAQLRTWVELSESWWAQFCWSPYHRSARPVGQVEAA
jgi:hypothetical protein